MVKRETIELVRAYDKIHQVRVRNSIVATVKALGESDHAKLLLASGRKIDRRR